MSCLSSDDLFLASDMSKAERRVAGIRHRDKSALWFCSQILHLSLALVSLQGLKILERVWEKKDTHWGDAAQGCAHVLRAGQLSAERDLASHAPRAGCLEPGCSPSPASAPFS